MLAGICSLRDGQCLEQAKLILLGSLEGAESSSVSMTERISNI